MQQKPVGTLCQLYYDTDSVILAGHYIVSSGGSGYRIQEVRKSQTKTNRHYLKCVRCKPAEIPVGSIIHSLYWYRRS